MNNINPIDNTDTLDEEIQKVLLQNGYSDIRHFNECVAELKTLFTEHSKQARIDELNLFTPVAESWVAKHYSYLGVNYVNDRLTYLRSLL